MEWSKVGHGTVARAHRRGRRAGGRSSWGQGGSGLVLGLVGLLVVSGRSAGQVPAHVRLVDPHTITGATKTAEAGTFKLGNDDEIYVPSRCVGEVRCPLFFFSGGTGVTKWMRPAADTFGIIVTDLPSSSTPSEYQGSNHEQIMRYMEKRKRYPMLDAFDSRLKEIMARFAIDPDKIAVGGFSSGTTFAAHFGPYNLNVFSRIVFKSGVGSRPLPFVQRPPDAKTEILFIEGVVSENYAVNSFSVHVPKLRQLGYNAEQVLNFRGHSDRPETYWFIGKWLHDSWATPDPAARPAPRVVVDSLVPLTPDALAKMTAFWIRFNGGNQVTDLKVTDSIRTIGRMSHLQRVVVPVGEVRPSVVMMDMAAMAAAYPAVRAALRNSGLTAQEHDAYRIALLTAELVTLARREKLYKIEPDVLAALDKIVATTPVLKQNVEFLMAHPAQRDALVAAGMWWTP